MKVFLFLVVFYAFLQNCTCFQSPYPANFTYNGLSIKKHDGIYYLLITNEKSIEISSSTDLEEWSKPQVILNAENTEHFYWAQLYISDENKFQIFVEIGPIFVFQSENIIGPYTRMSSIELDPTYSPRHSVGAFDNRTIMFYMAYGKKIEGRVVKKEDDKFDFEEKVAINHWYPMNLVSFKIIRHNEFFYIFKSDIMGQIRVDRSKGLNERFDGHVKIRTGDFEFPAVHEIIQDPLGNSILIFSDSYLLKLKGIFSMPLLWDSNGWPQNSTKGNISTLDENAEKLKVPRATILGGPDLHFDKGSTINLTCTVQDSPQPPAYIIWYHEEQIMTFRSQRGGVRVRLGSGEVPTGFLLIGDARPSDSGNYSCQPANAAVARVRVHVSNDTVAVVSEDTLDEN